MGFDIIRRRVGLAALATGGVAYAGAALPQGQGDTMKNCRLPFWVMSAALASSQPCPVFPLTADI